MAATSPRIQNTNIATPKKHGAGPDKAAKDGDDHEDGRTRRDDDPGQDKTEHLPKMIRAEFRLFATVNDGGGDEANQREVGDDCDRFVLAGGRRRIDWGRRGSWIVHSSINSGLMFGFAKNDSAILCRTRPASSKDSETELLISGLNGTWVKHRISSARHSV